MEGGGGGGGAFITLSDCLVFFFKYNSWSIFFKPDLASNSGSLGLVIGLLLFLFRHISISFGLSSMFLGKVQLDRAHPSPGCLC